MRFGVVAVVLVLLGAGAPARADEDDARRKASDHFARAVAAEKKGDWKTALREYQAAYDLAPSADVLYNMARDHEKLGNAIEAAALYERYVDEHEGPEDLAEVTRRAASLREKVGRKLLDAALQAKGGAAKLKRVRTVRARGRMSVTTGGKTISGTFVRWLAGGDRTRVETTVGGQTEIMAVTPGTVWRQAGGVAGLRSAEESTDARAALWRDKDLVVLRHREPGTIVRGVGPDSVEIAREGGKDKTTIILDAKTRLPVGFEFDNHEGHFRVEIGDYRTVRGVKYAFRVVNKTGTRTTEVEVEELTIDAPLPDQAFDLPAP